MKEQKDNKTSGSRAALREAILSGHYASGQPLPSARDLAREMKISKSLVHNILKLLQEENLIRIYPNRGAIVNEHHEDAGRLKRFFLRPSDFGAFRYLPVTGQLLAAIAAGAENRNTEMMVSFSDSGNITGEIISHYRSGLIQGMIYVQCMNRGLITPLEEANIPYVIASDTYGLSDTVRTYVDYRAVARMAVQYLHNRGMRHIGIITGSRRDYLYAEILAGYRGALAEEDLPYHPEYVSANLAFEQADNQVELVKKFLARSDRPEAVFTVRDYRARWLYQAAAELGLRIPEDLSVISFDNHTWPEASAYGLTTIAEPLREQGEAAVALLQKWVTGGNRPESQEIKPLLIERKSVKDKKHE